LEVEPLAHRAGCRQQRIGNRKIVNGHSVLRCTNLVVRNKRGKRWHPKRLKAGACRTKLTVSPNAGASSGLSAYAEQSRRPRTTQQLCQQKLRSMTHYHSKLRLPNTPVSVQALLGRHLSKIPDENTPEQEFNLIRSLCPPKAFPAAFDVNSKI